MVRNNLGEIVKSGIVLIAGAELGLYTPANSMGERIGAMIGSALAVGVLTYCFLGDDNQLREMDVIFSNQRGYK